MKKRRLAKKNRASSKRKTFGVFFFGGLSLASFVLMVLCVVLLGGLIFIYIVGHLSPECGNWERDEELAQSILFPERDAKDAENALQHVDIVYVYPLSGVRREMYPICELFYGYVITLSAAQDIASLAHALRSGPRAADTAEGLAGPSWHMLFIDRDQKRYAYLITIAGAVAGQAASRDDAAMYRTCVAKMGCRDSENAPDVMHRLGIAE